MPEQTVDLIEYLHVQQERFTTVTSRLASSGIKFASSISLGYTFLSYNIDLLTPADGESLQFFRWRCNLDESKPSAPEIYCPDKGVELLMRDIQPISYLSYRAAPLAIGGLFTEETMKYIRIADEVAKQAYQCNAGDNYYPGYFSEIILSHDVILLSQINRWNSRSIDHKDDYSMRELKFSIPCGETEISNVGIDREYIGRMSVDFSDLSSKNNRACGKLIREQIKHFKVH